MVPMVDAASTAERSTTARSSNASSCGRPSFPRPSAPPCFCARSAPSPTRRSPKRWTRPFLRSSRFWSGPASPLAEAGQARQLTCGEVRRGWPRPPKASPRLPARSAATCATARNAPPSASSFELTTRLSRDDADRRAGRPQGHDRRQAPNRWILRRRGCRCNRYIRWCRCCRCRWCRRYRCHDQRRHRHPESVP